MLCQNVALLRARKRRGGVNSYPCVRVLLQVSNVAPDASSERRLRKLELVVFCGNICAVILRENLPIEAAAAGAKKFEGAKFEKGQGEASDT